MGLRELLILALILGIVGFILRGLIVFMHSRRNQIKIALDKNVPHYDLEEIEFRELPNGGARVVERSFAHVVQQNARFVAGKSAPGKKASTARAAAAVRPTPAATRPTMRAAASGARAAAAIPVLMNSVATKPAASIAKPTPVIEDMISALENELDAQLEASKPERFKSEEARSEEVKSEEVKSDATYSNGMDRVTAEFASAQNGNSVASHDSDLEAELDAELAAELDEQIQELEQVRESSESGIEFSERFEPESELEPESNTEHSETVSETETHEEFDDEYGRVFIGDDLSDADLLGHADDDRPTQTETEESSAVEKPTGGGLFAWLGARLSALTTGKPSAADTDDYNDRDDDDHDILFDDPQDKEVSPVREAPRHARTPAPEPEGFASNKDFGQQNLLNMDDDGALPADMSAPEPVPVPAAPAGVSASATKRAPARQAEDTNNNTAADYNEVMIMNVMARADAEFAGVDMLQVLLGSGLRFGEMSIFHRHVDDKGNGPVLFSVANVFNPGTFDLNRINDFSTRGLCFFLTLPNVINNMQAFDRMLETAQKVRLALDGELKDDNRSVMTAQTVEHYRQRIRDFELRQMREQH